MIRDACSLRDPFVARFAKFVENFFCAATNPNTISTWASVDRSAGSRRCRSDRFNYCNRAPAILLPLVTTGSALSCSLTITTTCVMSSKARL